MCGRGEQTTIEPDERK